MSNKIKELFTRNDLKVQRWTFGVMLVGGIAALIAAFTLTIDKFQLYEDPNAILSCSINIALNCTAVMQTWQSSLFGFPNMVIGLMAYAVVVTVALAGLVGVKFPRWWLIAANIGFAFGLIFAYWLFFQSLYSIEVLCPWCLIVTTSTTLIFASMTHYNLYHNTFKLPAKTNDRVQRFLKAGFHQMIVLAWIALMVVLVFLKFGDALFA